MAISKALSLRELHIRSGLSLYLLHRAIKNGELPAFPITDGPNASLRVLEEDYNTFIQRRKNALATEYAKTTNVEKRASGVTS